MEKIKLGLQKCVRAVGFVFHYLLKILSVVFGHIQYQWPPWVLKIKGFILSRLQQFDTKFPNASGHFKKGLGAVSIATIVGVAGYYAYHYFRPPLVQIDLTQSTPGYPDILKPKPLPYRLFFSEPVASLQMLGKEDAEHFSIRPKIEGQWVWKTDREVQFLPKASSENPLGWETGQTYTVTAKDGFFPKGLELAKEEIEFSFWDLEITKSGDELYRDPVNPKVQIGSVQFNFRFPVNTEDVRRRISAKLKTKQGTETFAQTISLNTKFNELENVVYVTTENITTPLEDSVLVIEIEKGSLGKWGGKAEAQKSEIPVPGRNSLRIQTVRLENVRNERFEPEQALVVQASLPVSGRNLSDQIEVFLLPEREKNQRWQSISELEQKDFDQAEKIELALHPTEKVETEYQSFKVKVPSLRQLFVRVRKGLTNAADYVMPLEFEELVETGEAPKEIMMMGHGVLLSISGDKKIPILARNVMNVNAELFRLLPEQISQITRESLSSSYLSAYFSESMLWDATQKFTKTLSILKDGTSENGKNENDTAYTALDLSDVLKGGQKGLFYVRLSEAKAKPESADADSDSSEVDASDEYHYGSSSSRDQRLILITDLGLIAKKDFAGQIAIFVQNLRTGGPVPGAKVQVMGRNGLTLFEETTNEDGVARFPKLSDFQKEKQPTAFIATKGDDYVFMPIESYERKLDYSKFDVGGIYESTESDSLVAYTFSDRGMYRPGEDVKIGFIVRTRLMSKVEKGIPLEALVIAPDGSEVDRRLIRVNTDDLDDFSWSSQDESPTGIYRFKLQVPRGKKPEQLIGEVEFRVEEFVPDELSIFANYGVETSLGWSQVSKADLKITLKNLFGTPAQDRQVETKLKVVPVQPYFRKYSKYRFAFDNKDNLSMVDDLPSVQTSSSGEAIQTVDLTKLAAGFYQVTLDTQALQAGSGRAVYARSQSYFSNTSYLIGTSSESDLSYLRQSSEHKAELIAIDANLNLTQTEELDLELYKIEYVSSLIRQPNGLFKYQSIKKDNRLKLQKIAFKKESISLSIPTETSGDFYYSVKDKDGSELTRISFSVVGDGGEQRGLDRSSELKMTLKTKDFSPEAEIEMEIRAPFSGAGLITIEREKVLAYKWFKSSTATSVQKIKIPAGVEGHAYLNVMWLRSMDSKQIYTNPLSYAVEPFTVSLDKRKNEIKLELPDLVKPGEEIRISYSATEKTPILIYGVNEGILQVAKYSNPNVVDFFFKRRALQVSTFQLIDLLRPDFSILQSLAGGNAATGGDMEGGGDSMSLNPFKRKSDPPVVFWSGNLTADVTKKVYTYRVPDHFNGSMRILAVSANASKFAVKTGQVTIRGDLILTPSIPFFLAPADEFEGTVVVSNQKRGSGPNAEVELTLSGDLIQFLDETKIKLAVPEGEERSHTIKMKALDQLGAAMFKAEAVIGAGADRSTARRSISLSVRPAQVFQTTFEFLELKKDASVPILRDVYEPYSSGQVTFSSLPLAFVGTAEAFLSNYEYSCTEQLMSRALGFAALERLGWQVSGRAQLEKKKAVKVQEEILKAINQVRTRQLSDGSFSLYPYGSSMPSLTHQFLLLDDQIKKAGLNLVPAIMVERALRNLQLKMNQNIDFENEDATKLRNSARDLYWLARSGKLVTKRAQALSMVALAVKTNERDAVMEAYLASAFELLKMKTQATQHWNRTKIYEKPIWLSGDLSTQSSANAELFYLASLHNLELQKKWLSVDTLKLAFAEILNGQMQSQTAAMSLVAAQSLLDTQPAELEVSASETLKSGTTRALVVTGKRIKRAQFDPQLQTILAKSSQALFLGIGVSGFSKLAPAKEIQKGISVVRDYLLSDASDAKPVTEAVLGDEVIVRIRFKTTDGGTIDQAAIVDLLPAGLEPVLSSIPTNQARDVRAEGSSDYSEGGEESEMYSGASEEGTDGSASEGEPTFQSTGSSFSSAQIRSVDRREDRVVIYAAIDKEAQEFSYKAKVVAVGRFKIPAAFAENMYDSNVFYMGTEGQFVVRRK